MNRQIYQLQWSVIVIQHRSAQSSIPDPGWPADSISHRSLGSYRVRWQQSVELSNSSAGWAQSLACGTREMAGYAYCYIGLLLAHSLQGSREYYVTIYKLGPTWKRVIRHQLPGSVFWRGGIVRSNQKFNNLPSAYFMVIRSRFGRKNPFHHQFRLQADLNSKPP